MRGTSVRKQYKESKNRVLEAAPQVPHKGQRLFQVFLYLGLRAHSHMKIGKAGGEVKCSEMRGNIDFRDTVFQKLWQNVQFAMGAYTQGLLGVRLCLKAQAWMPR